MTQLAGIRVLDLGIWRPVPYCTQLLAQLGADVIKVEPPGGDPMRMFPALFATLIPHKRTTEVDLRTPEGLAQVMDLAAGADVVVEGFRPGVADRLGVGESAVRRRNSRAVYCSVSGYGQTGPLAQVPGHDINYQATAGMLAESAGGTPGVPIADLASGMAAAMAICAALVRAARTGRGERIDVGMADVLATWTGDVGATGMVGAEGGPRGVAGYGIFDTADGALVLGIVTEDRFWAALCEALDLPYADVSAPERFRRSDELNAAIAGALSGLSRDDAVSRLERHGVPVSAVLTREEMLASKHFRDRRIVVDGRLGHPVVYRDAPALAPTAIREPETAPGWLTSEGP